MGKKITDYKEHIKNNIKEVWNERLLSNCWEWQRYCDKWGYGTTRYKGKRLLTHKVSYLEFVGDIPEYKPPHGPCVLHHCDNPPCCNPDHLWLGSHKDNVHDMMNKGRHGGGHLKTLDALEIRARYATGDYIQKELADEYGVCESSISKIINNKTGTYLQ